MDFSNFNITIVGLGAIGGSFAMAIKENIRVKNVWGIDLDKKTLIEAKALGIIKEGYQGAKEPLKDSDIVFLCIYPEDTISFVRNHLEDFKEGAIIIETTGIKASLVNKLQPIIPTNLDLIFGHPLAGKESKGLHYASGTIFKGANFLLTPSEKNKPKNLNIIKEMLLDLGFNNIKEIESAEHDAMIAFSSHLPHVIAISLMLNPALEEFKLSCGTSFQDATRVAKINSALWTELLIENRVNIVRHLNTFIADLEDIKALIIDKDKIHLKEALRKAGYRKENLL